MGYKRKSGGKKEKNNVETASCVCICVCCVGG